MPFQIQTARTLGISIFRPSMGTRHEDQPGLEILQAVGVLIDIPPDLGGDFHLLFKIHCRPSKSEGVLVIDPLRDHSIAVRKFPGTIDFRYWNGRVFLRQSAKLHIQDLGSEKLVSNIRKLTLVPVQC